MENRNHITPVHVIAEYVCPAYTCIDHLGKTHRLRKYFLLGNLGVTDENAIHSILPAKSEYKKILFDVYFEAIIVFTETACFAFSFDGNSLFTDNQFETLEEIKEKLQERRNSWSQSDEPVI